MKTIDFTISTNRAISFCRSSIIGDVVYYSSWKSRSKRETGWRSKIKKKKEKEKLIKLFITKFITQASRLHYLNDRLLKKCRPIWFHCWNHSICIAPRRSLSSNLDNFSYPCISCILPLIVEIIFFRLIDFFYPKKYSSNRFILKVHRKLISTRVSISFAIAISSLDDIILKNFPSDFQDRGSNQD